MVFGGVQFAWKSAVDGNSANNVCLLKTFPENCGTLFLLLRLGSSVIRNMKDMDIEQLDKDHEY